MSARAVADWVRTAWSHVTMVVRSGSHWRRWSRVPNLHWTRGSVGLVALPAKDADSCTIVGSPVDDGAAHVVDGEVRRCADVSVRKSLKNDCGIGPTEAGIAKRGEERGGEDSGGGGEVGALRGMWRERGRWCCTLSHQRLHCKRGPQSQELLPCAMSRLGSASFHPTLLRGGGAPLSRNSKRHTASRRQQTADSRQQGRAVSVIHVMRS